MNIILSSRNVSKVQQIKEIFKNSHFNILSLDDANIEGEAIEDGLTLLQNAQKKARYAYEKSGGNTIVIADDTGIFITALGRAPGIKSARWAGESASTEEITQYTLDKMLGKTDRTAIFRTTAVLIDLDGDEHIFIGKCPGILLEHPRVKAQPGMPYSPLFIPNGSEKVWAQMSVEEENLISHRGKSFRAALEYLENNY